MHLSTLVQESQQRVTELSAQVMNEGLGTDNTEKEKQLKAWEWRYRLYKRMKAGYEHASKQKKTVAKFKTRTLQLRTLPLLRKGALTDSHSTAVKYMNLRMGKLRHTQLNNLPQNEKEIDVRTRGTNI